MKYHYQNLTDKIHGLWDHDCTFSPEDGCRLYTQIENLVEECESRVFEEENGETEPITARLISNK
jgi:hypothetical protein